MVDKLRQSITALQKTGSFRYIQDQGTKEAIRNLVNAVSNLVYHVAEEDKLVSHLEEELKRLENVISETK